MLIIFNTETKEFVRWHGTNSDIPNGSFSDKTLNLRKNEDYIKIPDDSEFAKLLFAGVSAEDNVQEQINH